MKIWHLNFEVDKYDNLVPEKAFSVEEIWAFDGRKLEKSWKPLPVKRMEPQKKRKLSDAPGFTIPVFSIEALSVLRPLMQGEIEELELLFDEHEYYGINVITVLDVIDYDKAKYIKYSDGHGIMLFTEYAFRMESDIGSHHIFKIIDEPRRGVFVSDQFRETVERHKLTGFKFRLAWDSDRI